MLFIYITIFLATALGAILKYQRTKELSSKLGREVEDHELVSLNSWIEAEEKSENKRTDFKRKTVDYKSNDKKSSSNKAKNKVVDKTKKAVAAAPEKLPNNCLNCGAVLSQGTARCGFCGTLLSRKLIEENCAVFLLDLEKDFESSIPASHQSLRLGCFLIPVLAFLTMFFFGGFFVAQDLFCGVAVGSMVLSLILAYAWNHWTDKILTRRENSLFDQIFTPKIRQFMTRAEWQPLEFLSVAKSHLDENSELLKQLHRTI
jgi:hypothetical protein